MDKIVGNYYLVNKELFNCCDINYQFDNSPFRLYEVLRSTNGVLLFLDDHIQRLKQGAISIGIDPFFDEYELRFKLSNFLKSNSNRVGNVKILFSTAKESEKTVVYYIPHSYPDVNLYNIGVEIVTLKCLRSDPKIKQVEISNIIRQKIEKMKLTSNAFEVLLVNNQNFITEGSKSNFFLVNNNAIYSAPDESILSGVTRKYVLDIAEREGIEINYKYIEISEIENFDAAFICGTSPKIMPISKINTINFNVKNSIINLIRLKYDSIIEKYLADGKL